MVSLPVPAKLQMDTAPVHSLTATSWEMQVGNTQLSGSQILTLRNLVRCCFIYSYIKVKTLRAKTSIFFLNT